MFCFLAFKCSAMLSYLLPYSGFYNFIGENSCWLQLETKMNLKALKFYVDLSLLVPPFTLHNSNMMNC